MLFWKCGNWTGQDKIKVGIVWNWWGSYTPYWHNVCMDVSRWREHTNNLFFILSFCIFQAAWGVKRAVVTVDVPYQVLYGSRGLSYSVKLHVSPWELNLEGVEKHMSINTNQYVGGLTRPWGASDSLIEAEFSQIKPSEGPGGLVWVEFSHNKYTKAPEGVFWVYCSQNKPLAASEGLV